MTRAQQIADLHSQGLSQRQIARAAGVSQPMVHRYLHKLGLIPSAHPRGDNPEESPAPLPADNPRRVLSPAPFPADDTWPPRQVEVCKNCRQEIPGARLGQAFCCNVCSAYAQGSRLVQFGQHSDGCALEGQPWEQAGLER